MSRAGFSAHLSRQHGDPLPVMNTYNIFENGIFVRRSFGYDEAAALKQYRTLWGKKPRVELTCELVEN